MEAAEREPHAVLAGELAVASDDRAVDGLGELVRLVDRVGHEVAVLGHERHLPAEYDDGQCLTGSYSSAPQ